MGNDGDDSIVGGTGADSLSGGQGADTVSGGAGNDTLTGGEGEDSLLGGSGDDTIFAGTGNDFVEGGDGNDVISGGDTSATILNGDFSAGSANWIGGASGIEINREGVYLGNGSSNRVAEIDVAENETTTLEQNFAVTEAGSATLSFDGVLRTSGELGLDGYEVEILDSTGAVVSSMTVLPTSHTTFETYTLDVVFPDPNTYTLRFTEIGDSDGRGALLDNVAFITGTDGDTLAGGDGDDTIAGNGGSDSIDGGAGADSLSGGQGDDTVLGGTGNDTITGEDGDDSLFGGGGSDFVSGGGGDDYIDGGFNTDILDGGEGNDTISYLDSFGNPSAESLDLDLEAGTALLNGVGNEIATNFENAISGNTTDTITGTAGGNEISSGGGNDVIDGAAGSDTLDAGTGDDTITGGEGSDSITAGSGNDTIFFAEGDTASGDEGNDLFALQDLGETTNGTITIVGGQGGEKPDDGNAATFEGDTLQLNGLADRTTLVQTSDGINSDGNESFSGSVTLNDGTTLNFTEIEHIVCFSSGTRIATPQGRRDIATLQVGDLVMTRDHSLQPIRWIQSRTVPALDRFAPIRIKPGVVTGQTRDLFVSPQHRMLFQGYQAELLFGESEVLIAAKHLVDGKLITQNTGGYVTYIHMMFDAHEIVYAEGAATESFHPGSIGLSALSNPAREELFEVFPELRSNIGYYGKTARHCLRKREAELLRLAMVI